MWPYVLLTFVPIIIQETRHLKISFNPSELKRRSKLPMIIFWSFLTLLLVFRSEKVGIDLSKYLIIFKSVGAKSWGAAITRSAEVANNFMLKAIYELTADFRWVMVISAILSVLFISWAYVKYSSDASLTIVLFMNMTNFILLFSGLRQSIAISLGFLAFEFVRSKKIVPFILIVALAMLFHTSAFMLAFMYPLYRVRITRKWLVGIIPAMLILFLFNKPVFTFLGSILERFTKYDSTITQTGSYTMLVLLAMFAAFSFIIPDEKSLDDDTVGMRNFLLLAVMLQMFAPLHTIAMRMNYYYIAFIPLVIPRIIAHRSVRWNQIAIIARYVFIVYFCLYFFFSVYQKNDLMTFPYRFFWETA